ncbi:MAG TPA: glycine zipper 2TM domain-containing protein [Xanthomonadales bacterium]|nr:glycine zipper 2TM domain-containing protein [Xanthomonadales bacterium]
MKRLNTVLLTASLALVCAPAWAGHRQPGYDYAKVVRATPLFETVRYPVDEQVCWEEQTWQRRGPSAAPVVLGAVIGGVVGHQFGGGNGKAALTVAGAALGGTIGAQVARDNYRGGAYPVVQTRCEIQRNWRTEERITAWDVAYRYRGNIYHTRTLENPGRRIRVRVDVGPAPYYRGH